VLEIGCNFDFDSGLWTYRKEVNPGITFRVDV